MMSFPTAHTGSHSFRCFISRVGLLVKHFRIAFRKRNLERGEFYWAGEGIDLSGCSLSAIAFSRLPSAVL
jgi:hypothetical protein